MKTRRKEDTRFINEDRHMTSPAKSPYPLPVHSIGAHESQYMNPVGGMADYNMNHRTYGRRPQGYQQQQPPYTNPPPPPPPAPSGSGKVIAPNNVNKVRYPPPPSSSAHPNHRHYHGHHRDYSSSGYQGPPPITTNSSPSYGVQKNTNHHPSPPGYFHPQYPGYSPFGSQQQPQRRILTNLNATQPPALVNRRFDMSPESNNGNFPGNSQLDYSSSANRSQGGKNRRRSSGTGQLAIKRSDQAPVTLKGWLYKQGSDGLMLWKKRWFVLSEFCLFYYKSSDEEKVSGSILLPSYKISPVSKEDGVVYHRKFCFKAEHHNMRTYFFAAENKESMIQWMNALSLASILQQQQEFKLKNKGSSIVLPPTSRSQQQRNFTSPQQSNNGNNSVKVIQHHPPAVYRMFNSNGTAYVPAALTTPVSSSASVTKSSLASNDFSGIQPLYANAPPKPARRLNSSRDYSPDSDSEHQILPNLQQSSHRLPHERRTPEAYARSHSHQIFRQPNYEDQTPYTINNKLQNFQRSHGRLNDPRFIEANGPSFPNGNNTLSPQKRTPRPHSADFLEYDRGLHPGSTQDDQVITNRRRGGQQNIPPRPKSSIDQPRMFRNEEEFHLWSEESYAQKMREQQIIQQQQHHHQYQNSSSRSQSRMSFARESNYNDSEAEVEQYFPTPMPRTPKNGYNPGNPYQNLPIPRSTPSSSNTPINVMQQQPIYNGTDTRLEAMTPNRLPELSHKLANDNEDYDSNGDFKRSSSARLPRQRRSFPEVIQNEDPRKKEQREESMKRLLEWKQRMLQSPLTRKSSRNASRTQTPTNSSSPIPSSSFAIPQSSHDYIKQKVLEEFEKHDTSSSSSFHPRFHHYNSNNHHSYSEKRLSRKGSSGSRSSRSRSSPRLCSKRDLSSSDEDEDDSRDHRQPRRRTSSSGQCRQENNVLKKKIKENLWEITSQDLLGKSHEELVLMLIHLRRQSAALSEAIDASTAELENITNANDQPFFLVEDLRSHIRDLEEQQARGRPIVSLVDNMVKLGTLYRGPEGAPLSHRLRNIPATPIHDEEISRESATTKQSRADIQELLQRSLEVVRQNINGDKELSSEERENLAEEQKQLENELNRVTNELESCQKKLDECSSDHARWEHDVLFLRQKLQTSASRDMTYGLGQSAETLLVENELAQVQQRASELHKTRQAIRSEVDRISKAPAESLSRVSGSLTEADETMPRNIGKNEYENMPLTLDDTDERIRKFYGLIPTSKIESKTVRSVKRDSKERSIRKEDEEEEVFSNAMTFDTVPPAPLPRGNYQNLHDFLNCEEVPSSSIQSPPKRQQMPRTNSTTAGLSGTDSRTINTSIFNRSTTDYFKNSRKDERPASSLSAHERLFGSSRENSMSPPISPHGLSKGSSGADSISSSLSANSPIFKSAAAKAIIQEIGGSVSHRRLKKRDKKRSYTITGGSTSSAVIEALNDRTSRARDDMDMERALRGSNRPNAPDVVKSTLDKKDAKINPSSIDNLFGVPDKIVIPERYIPETDIDNISKEERQVRLKKADSIRRMLTETASTTDDHQNVEDKKQKERLLSLNQVLAREVMEKSRMVAGQSRMKH